MKNITEHTSRSQTSFAHQSDIPQSLTWLPDMFTQASHKHHSHTKLTSHGHLHDFLTCLRNTYPKSTQVMPQPRSVDFEQKIFSAKISFAQNEKHHRTHKLVTNFIDTPIWHPTVTYVTIYYFKICSTDKNLILVRVENLIPTNNWVLNDLKYLSREWIFSEWVL